MTRKRAFVFFSLLALAGCSSPPPPEVPAVREAASAWSQRGEAAYRSGEFEVARAAFEEALRISASLDDAKAMVRQLLNLGSTRYALDDAAGARSAFEQVLALGGRASAPLRAQAAYRLAVIETDAGNRTMAGELLDRSLALCGEAPCDVRGPAHNVRARLALAGDDASSAEADATRALEYNRRLGDRVEEANSLWLLAETAMARGDSAQAQSRFTQALELDRALAQPRKIVRDLMGLARSTMAQGRDELAIEFARRARRAAHSSGDAAAVAEAERFLSSHGASAPAQ